MSDIYLSITETPTVVTLTNPLISSNVAQTVTVANTVTVALDSNSLSALEQVTVTVGAAVTISNFPATQTISGTVTASIVGSVTVGSMPQISGTVTANVFGKGYLNNFYQIPVSAEGADAVTAGLAIGFHEDLTADEFKSVKASDPFPVQIRKGTVTIGSLPAISGTVTANLPALNWNTVKIAYGANDVWNGIYKKTTSGYVDVTGAGTPQYLPVDGAFFGGVSPQLTRGTYPGGLLSFTGTRWYFEQEGEVEFYSTTTATDLRVITNWTDSGGAGANVQITPYSVEPVAIPGGVAISSLPAISGTVTANSLTNLYDEPNDQYLSRSAAFVEISAGEFQPVGINNNMPISGTVTVGNSVTIGSLPTLSPVLPRVTFLDGSGTVTTANSAVTVFASSSTRSYLLVQVTTGSAFVNVGATATTLNGINLTAGQGYAWETTIPQGIVSLISTTTSTNYVAKEA